MGSTPTQLCLMATLNSWVRIPATLFQLVSEFVSDRDRLCVIERTCSQWHRWSFQGLGWSHLNFQNVSGLAAPSWLNWNTISSVFYRRLRKAEIHSVLVGLDTFKELADFTSFVVTKKVRKAEIEMHVVEKINDQRYLDAMTSTWRNVTSSLTSLSLVVFGGGDFKSLNKMVIPNISSLTYLHLDVDGPTLHLEWIPTLENLSLRMNSSVFTADPCLAATSSLHTLRLHLGTDPECLPDTLSKLDSWLPSLHKLDIGGIERSHKMPAIRLPQLSILVLAGVLGSTATDIFEHLSSLSHLDVIRFEFDKNAEAATSLYRFQKTLTTLQFSETTFPAEFCTSRFANATMSSEYVVDDIRRV